MQKCTASGREWRKTAGRLVALSLFFSALAGAGFGCAAAKSKATSSAAGGGDIWQRPASRGLPAQEALARKARVARVDYALELALDAERPEFSGVVTIDLDLNSAGLPLNVDFFEGAVERVEIDRRAVPVAYNGLFLTLPGDALTAGRHLVTIAFRHKYSTSGDGLHRFRDKEDGRTYLYSDFEPFDANQMFPCLDQPDLKATYTLKAEVPADWTVVSTMREQTVGVAAAEGRRVWVFPKSPKLSTYVYSLHAGPYMVWRGSAGRVPLRLFARQSLAKHVEPEAWLANTKKGFAFYERYFGIPYPFEKYDQLIVPEFNSGGMENAAAITYSEFFVHRAAMTETQKEMRASVQLHELAHMWFGDLVTMTWWNGLWLNESFATFMASLGLHEATEFKQSWLTFYSGRKRGAYLEDQLATTHPIDVPVDDTMRALANFDNITYSKGASSLKQLAFFLGHEKFRRGVSSYLNAHRYSNARLEDFLGALEQASGRDLKTWAVSWLKTSGVSRLAPRVECVDGRIARLSLETDAKAELGRPHRTRVGLYDEALKRYASAEYEYVVSGEVKALAGKACPALVYPNDGDEDYVKAELDERSLAAVKASLEQARDPLLRAMLWGTLWEMVRDVKFAVSEFAELALRALPSETDLRVSTLVTGSLMRALHYLPLAEGEAGSGRGLELASRIEAMYLALLERAKAGTDTQKLWFDSYLGVVRTDAGLERIARVLDGKLAYPGLKIDPDRRWTIITRLNAFGAPGAAGLIGRELESDKSDRAVKAAITAEVVRPELKVKEKWFHELNDPATKLSTASLKQALALFPRMQQQFRAEFADRFYDSLPAMSRRDNHYQRDYTYALVPALCTAESVARLAGYIEKHDELTAGMLKTLRNSHEEDERCVRVRGFALEKWKGKEAK